MNQKGFSTIFGLCLVLVIALVVKGIEESEMNYTYEVTDFQAEFELQNAADSGIYDAVKITLEDPDGTLPIMNPDYPGRRKDYQHKFNNLTIKSESLGTITVETWGERMGFSPYKVNYSGTSAVAVEDTARNALKDRKIYVFLSIASVDSKRMSGKIYRRAFAYVFAEGDDATIHFAELPTSSYKPFD